MDHLLLNLSFSCFIISVVYIYKRREFKYLATDMFVGFDSEVDIDDYSYMSYLISDV